LFIDNFYDYDKNSNKKILNYFKNVANNLQELENDYIIGELNTNDSQHLNDNYLIEIIEEN
jgi:hypothetical protein